MGISTYVIKPVRRAELLAAVRHALHATARGQTRPSPSVAVEFPRSEVEGNKPLEILLAEDNAVNRTLACRLLEKKGHKVATASNGREALRALEQQKFDVILMDIQMLELDGLEATALIREREALTGTHIPIIAMTAYAMKGDEERFLAAGMDGYIAKPIRVEHLFRILEQSRQSEPATKG